jgi:4-amino-4-deoxychorismate lyase
MSRLVESIKILNGRIYNLAAHQARFDRSRFACFGCTDHISLREKITTEDIPAKGLFKCRVLYNAEVESVSFSPYHYPDIRTLKIVRTPEIEYDYKWAERPGLDALFRQKVTADEIIIIKNGLVTDAYYYNLIFEKNGALFTPDTPLLHGTKRERLLATGQIRTARIAEQDIVTFEKIHLINAMTDLGRIVVDVRHVIRP